MRQAFSTHRLIEMIRAEARADGSAESSPEEMAAACGFTLDRWQQEVCESPSRQLLLCCGRQVGKSTVAGLLALREAVVTPGALVLLVAPALRQSLELFRRVRECWRAWEGFDLVEEESQLRAEFANNSRIIALPGGNEATVRGYARVALVVIDEAARIKDELLHALKPMVATSGGRVMMISSPWGRRGVFFENWENGGDTWERWRIPSTSCPRIPASFIEGERRQMPNLYFRSEYMAEFVDARGSYFPSELVESLFTDEAEPLFPAGSPFHFDDRGA